MVFKTDKEDVMLPKKYYSQSEQYIIYALIDPRSKSIRYIGKTSRGYSFVFINGGV